MLKTMKKLTRVPNFIVICQQTHIKNNRKK